jgi:hypothetical protein
MDGRRQVRSQASPGEGLRVVAGGKMGSGWRRGPQAEKQVEPPPAPHAFCGAVTRAEGGRVSKPALLAAQGCGWSKRGVPRAHIGQPCPHFWQLLSCETAE